MVEEHLSVKEKNMVYKYLNKLPSKYQFVNLLIAIFVGIVMFNCAFYVNWQYNDSTALIAGILFVFCYLSFDLIFPAGVKGKFMKLTRRKDEELSQGNKAEQEKESMEESLKKQNMALSDKIEELHKQLGWISKELENLKCSVVKKVCKKLKPVITDKLERRQKHYDSCSDESDSSESESSSSSDSDSDSNSDSDSYSHSR